MTDTSPTIQQIQLEIWLLKSPMERLRQTLEDNDALFAFWNALKKAGPGDEPLSVDNQQLASNCFGERPGGSGKINDDV